MEYLIRDRLSWLRFLGFDLGAPDANTIRLFREKLTEAGALEALFADFDRQLKERGYLAMGGQIVDATLVAAPKQRNTQAEKAAIKDGKKAGEIWPDKPAKAAQKDTDARWALKFAKGRPAADGKPQVDIAIPSFGYKSSIAICRAFGFIRKGKTTDAARFDGRMLRDVVTNDNTASDVWADTAYRSQANEKWLKRMGRVSRIHRRKPRGKPMPERTANPFLDQLSLIDLTGRDLDVEDHAKDAADRPVLLVAWFKPSVTGARRHAGIQVGERLVRASPPRCPHRTVRLLNLSDVLLYQSLPAHVSRP